jgi:hypothetical protein
VAMFVFLQCLAFHLSTGVPGGAWIIATSIPVAGVIAYAVFVEDRKLRRAVRIVTQGVDAYKAYRSAPVAQRTERLREDTKGGQ